MQTLFIESIKFCVFILKGKKYGEVKADLDRIFGDYARYMESAKNKSIAKLTDMLED